MTGARNEWNESEASRWLHMDLNAVNPQAEAEEEAEFFGEEETVIARRTRRTKAAAEQSAETLSARDRIVLEHLSLVKSIAIRIHETLPVHVELDDLTHAGILGLMDAATKFDAEKQVSFPSYAKHRIKGAILDSLRQLDWASRDLRRRHRQVETATRELMGELGRNPTEAETADRLGIDVDRLRQMTLEMRNIGLISADTRGSDHEDLPTPEFAGAEDSQPDSMCSKEQMRSVLERAMSGLTPRYRQVVTMYYTNEMTMKEIGSLLGINESRVSQIHKSALEKMNAALQNAGIHSSAAF